jgi:hypothetical protein
MSNDKYMYEDLKQWCDDGQLYLKCITQLVGEESVCCKNGSTYKAYDVIETEGNIEVFISTGLIGYDPCILINEEGNEDFEIVVLDPSNMTRVGRAMLEVYEADV